MVIYHIKVIIINNGNVTINTITKINQNMHQHLNQFICQQLNQNMHQQLNQYIYQQLNQYILYWSQNRNINDLELMINNYPGTQ